MNKEQQIKEIANMAVKGCCRNPQAYTAEECEQCDFKQGQCNAYRHAEKLYNAGYRKTDGENSAPIEWCYEQIIKAKRELEEQQRKYCHDYGKIRKMDAMEFAARLKYRISNLPYELQSVIINIIDSEVEVF